jgi:hypothetical protein
VHAFDDRWMKDSGVGGLLKNFASLACMPSTTLLTKDLSFTSSEDVVIGKSLRVK